MKLRRLTIPVTLLLFIAASAYAAESVSENTKAPKAMIGEKAYRFDPVVEGATVTHAYRVRNTGKSTLEITRVKTG